MPAHRKSVDLRQPPEIREYYNKKLLYAGCKADDRDDASASPPLPLLPSRPCLECVVGTSVSKYPICEQYLKAVHRISPTQTTLRWSSIAVVLQLLQPDKHREPAPCVLGVVGTVWLQSST